MFPNYRFPIRAAGEPDRVQYLWKVHGRCRPVWHTVWAESGSRTKEATSPLRSGHVLRVAPVRYATLRRNVLVIHEGLRRSAREFLAAVSHGINKVPRKTYPSHQSDLSIEKQKGLLRRTIRLEENNLSSLLNSFLLIFYSYSRISDLPFETLVTNKKTVVIRQW